MPSASRLLVAFFALPLACVSAPPRVASPSSPPPASALSSTYRSVHIDTLAIDKLALFEDARREWLAELQRAHASDGRGVFLQVGTNQFYTVRSFTRFAENDTRGETIERSLATIPKAASERYDRGDDALVFPHTSEIGRRTPTSITHPTAAPSPNARPPAVASSSRTSAPIRPRRRATGARAPRSTARSARRTTRSRARPSARSTVRGTS